MELFNDGQAEEIQMTEIKMPSTSGIKFDTPDVEASLKKDKITNAALGEVEGIEHPAYMIDLSEMYSILPCTTRAIKCMLLDNVDLDSLNAKRAASGQPILKADTALYIRNEAGIRLVGHGDGYMFYKQLDSFVRAAFDGKVKIYKSIVNTFTGELSFGEAKSIDVSQVVLRLDL